MVDFSRYETIQVERQDDILILTLNRPEVLNAVSSQMHTELSRIFLDVDEDDEANVVVLTGAGRAFCAGGDITNMTPEGAEARRHVTRVRGEAYQIVERMLAVEKPVIAMVNGAAVGLGATLALLCDIIVMAEDARIADTHVNVGLVAGDGGTVTWPLYVGPHRAKEMLMLGRFVLGAEAAAMGLVNHAVPRDELRSFTMTLARQLADQLPYAVRATKMAINRTLARQVLEQMDACLSWEGTSFQDPNHPEAAAAFLGKRRPAFARKV
ncbi:MAG: enoyl-CoA hydratase/isomerase family protein [Dehalococcoidia bacterium]